MNLPALPPRMQPRILVTAGGCWEWQGELNRNGYGRVWVNGRRLMAHRVAYQLLVGDIEPGLVLDHLCRNRRCCNPEHLEPVTVRENTLRGDAKLFKPLSEAALLKVISEYT